MACAAALRLLAAVAGGRCPSAASSLMLNLPAGGAGSAGAPSRRSMDAPRATVSPTAPCSGEPWLGWDMKWCGGVDFAANLASGHGDFELETEKATSLGEIASDVIPQMAYLGFRLKGQRS